MNINNLSEKNIVIRQQSKDDRRVVYVSLSKSGRDIANEYYKIFHEFAENFMDILSDDEIDTYIRIAKKKTSANRQIDS